jgi:predicted dehydrogenase
VLVHVADPDSRVAGAVRAIDPDVPISQDPTSLLADPNVDAVIIATPSPTHAHLACAAFAAGKHVLVEKPLALDLESADAVIAAGQRSGRVGMVGHLMVFHPAVAKLRELYRARELGRLHYIHSIRSNLGRLRREESVLWSFGPHDLSMMEAVLGEQPEHVSARGKCIAHPNVPDVAFVTLGYASGTLAHLQLSRVSPRKERRLTLVGADRVAEFDDVGLDKLRIYDKGYDHPPTFTQFAQYLTIQHGGVRILPLSMDEPLRLEVDHFLGCIETGRAPEASLESGRHTVSILTAAEASLRADGTAIPLVTPVDPSDSSA